MKSKALCSECMEKIDYKNMYAAYRTKSGKLRFVCRSCYVKMAGVAKHKFFSELYKPKKKLDLKSQ